jgi:hypothetical protein
MADLGTIDGGGNGIGKVLPFGRRRVLLDPHREHLRTSGLTDESIDLGGFWTERNRDAIAGLLQWRGWPKGRGDVLVIPFFVPGDVEPYLCRIRPDQPSEGKDGKIRKYEQPKGVPMGPYFPARARAQRWLEDASRPLAFVEGEKKAALLDQLGIATIGSTGVDCFHDKSHRDETDQYRLHELIRKHAVIADRQCLIVFDSDSADNDQVMRAARVLAWMLQTAGAKEILFVRIPPGEAGAKLGIDDFFVRSGEEATRALLSTALEPIEPLSGDDSRSLLKNYRALFGLPVDERLRMPRGYDIDRSGALIDVDGEKPELVERAPIFVRRLVADLYSGAENVEVVFKRNKAWRIALIPRRAMADARAALGELAPLGAPIDSNTGSKVVRWLRDFEASNEKRLPRSTSVARCGWHRIAGEDVFVLGEPLAKEGSTVELVLERHQDRGRLSRAFHSAGSYEEHLAALRAAWEASPIAAVVIAGALAAPLLRPLGAPLFAIHLAGDSSRGKSSMLKLAASLYGDPRDDEWVTSWNATNVGLEVRAATLCDLPLPIDEAGVTDARERERATYMLVNGVGRTRGAKEGGLRETHSWRTVVLSTGERLLAEESSATGAQVRVLQFEVDGFGDLDAAGVDALRRRVEESFGHVGKEWVQALLEITADDWEEHRGRLKALSRSLQASTAGGGLRARQAGYWALLAYVEALAADVLHLGRADSGTIRTLFESGTDSQIGVRPAADRAIDLVREWISARPGAFPRLVVATTGRKVPKGEAGQREIFGYLDGGAELLVIPNALRVMLAEHGIGDSVVLREWRMRGWIRAESADRFTVKCSIGGKTPRVVAIKGDAVGLTDDGDSPGQEDLGRW